MRLGWAPFPLTLLVLLGSCARPAEAPPPPILAAPQAPRAPVAEPAGEPERPDFWLSGTAAQGGRLIGRVPSGTTALDLDGAAVPITGEGFFMIAFDRDAAPVANLRALRPGREPLSRTITVAPTAWQIERINAPMRGAAKSDADFAARRPGELAQINAARARSIDSNGWRQEFIWPAVGRISGRFGSQRVYQGVPGSYHSGTDIALPTGTPFVAPADGVVVLAAETPFTLEGYLLIVDHGMGLSSAFLHCSALLVKEGDVVKQGQAIGRIGATGRASGPHLHWGMKWNAARIDPMLVAGPIG